MTYEYRVFVDGSDDSAVTHFSGERLWDGASFRVIKPGDELDGRTVVVYRLVSHPTEHGPGIAYGRDDSPGDSD